MNKKMIAAAIAGMMLYSFIPAHAEDTVTLDFDANATTGYAWTGFVLGGDSVELEDYEGVYVEDENTEGLTGVGGKTTFTLKALQPGRSIVLFEYGRSWEMDIEQTAIILADVDEAGNLTTMDISDTSIIDGTVTEILEEEGSVMINNEVQGDIIAAFPEDMEMPFVDEDVRLYTDGVMTMSLPPMVNVLAWGSAPSELAREGEYFFDDYDDIFMVEPEVVVSDVAEYLSDILTDESYLELMMGHNEGVMEVLKGYAETLSGEPVSITRKEWTEEKLFEELGEQADNLSDLARYELWKRANSASFLATRAASQAGMNEVAAASLAAYADTLYYDAEPGYFLVTYEDGNGMFLSIDYITAGISSVSACMIPDAKVMDEMLETVAEDFAEDFVEDLVEDDIVEE